MSEIVSPEARFGGRFSDLVRLAQGGEGSLYRVRDRWTGRMAALKVAGGSKAADSLLGEYRLLSRLRHPCLIKSQDLVRDGSDLAHLLEYVPATDPAQLWDEGGEEAVWAALVQALRGLTYLHRHGYVHGDVTPGNILVWREGERWRAKVADLGLVLPREEASGAGVRGTAGYMAPEVARGDGYGPKADLYGLAATAVAWIDGRGSWDGVSSTEVLKRLAGGPEVPRPRRRVSPELEAFLALLGRADPAERTQGDWSELRIRERSWGPPTLEATVVGVDDKLEEWKEWLRELPPGRVGTISVRGRVGTGRRTLCWAMARELVADGWTALWEMPLDTMRDWLEAQEGDPDPVALARQLARRFEDKSVVLLWPEEAGELESRLLRALLRNLDNSAASTQTLVLRSDHLSDKRRLDEVEGTAGLLVINWTGPSGVLAIRDDLFPLEEGYAGPSVPAIFKFSTPHAAVSMKRSGLDEPTDDRDDIVQDEIRHSWSALKPEEQTALVLLSWSEYGWASTELAHLFGWTPAEMESISGTLIHSQLIHHNFDSAQPYLQSADWFVKDAVAQCSGPAGSMLDLEDLGKQLEKGRLHPHDLGLVRVLIHGPFLPFRYVLGALDDSLSRGKYQAVMELLPGIRSIVDRHEFQWSEIWGRFLRAAEMLGRHRDEIEILRELLKWCEPLDSIEYRKKLAATLLSLGDWQESIECCSGIEAIVGLPGADRAWALLHRAESLWQAGRFHDAAVAYDHVESALDQGKTDEWLRYAVSRARQAGQSGEIAKVQSFLELADSKIGKRRCEEDPLYLHTRGGLAVQEADYAAAQPLLERARKRSGEEGNWAIYVMASARSSTLAYGMGQVWDAERIGRDAVTTATALGSVRTTAMSSSIHAFYEMHLGNLGSALRKAENLSDAAIQLEDSNMAIQAGRLRALVSAYGGWQDEVLESTKFLKDIGREIGENESVAYASLCRGVYEMGARNWQEARVHLSENLKLVKQIGKLDDELAARFHLCRVRMAIGERKQAIDEIQLLQEELGVRRFALLVPLVDLMRYSSTPEVRDVEGLYEILRVLWSEGRILDFVVYGPASAHQLPPDLNLDVRKKTLGAVQRMTASLDSALMRKRFLSFPQIREALVFARG